MTTKNEGICSIFCSVWVILNIQALAEFDTILSDKIHRVDESEGIFLLIAGIYAWNPSDLNWFIK